MESMTTEQDVIDARNEYASKASQGLYSRNGGAEGLLVAIAQEGGAGTDYGLQFSNRRFDRFLEVDLNPNTKLSTWDTSPYWHYYVDPSVLSDSPAASKLTLNLRSDRMYQFSVFYGSTIFGASGTLRTHPTADFTNMRVICGWEVYPFNWNGDESGWYSYVTGVGATWDTPINGSGLPVGFQSNVHNTGEFSNATGVWYATSPNTDSDFFIADLLCNISWSGGPAYASDPTNEDAGVIGFRAEVFDIGPNPYFW